MFVAVGKEVSFREIQIFIMHRNEWFLLEKAMEKSFLSLNIQTIITFLLLLNMKNLHLLHLSWFWLIGDAV